MKELTTILTGHFVGTAGVTADRILFKFEDVDQGQHLVGIQTDKAFLRDIDLKQQYCIQTKTKVFAQEMSENGPKIANILDVMEIEAKEQEHE